MLTEEQVLTKLASYKDAIIKIKNDRDKAKAAYADITSQKEQAIAERDRAYEDLQTVKNELETSKQHLIKVEDGCTEVDSELKNAKERLEEKEVAYDELHSQYLELQTFCNTVQEELKKVESQNGIYKSDISKLQKQLESIQQQSQQTLYNEKAAKENFMNEISRVINEASEVLD